MTISLRNKSTGHIFRSACAAFFMSLFAACFGPLSSASAADFTASQTRSIEKIVREYLIAHPEVMVEVMQELQKKQEAAEQKDQAAALTKYRFLLDKDPSSFVAGNPDGDVTIVEFFDYQCGYCKHTLQPLLDTVKKDGNIRLVLKEFPILSPESEVAAKAALASIPQGKYMAFHQALYKHKGGLTRAKIMSIAKSVGLDEERLARDMTDPVLDKAIERNRTLAQALVINGTPAFVIGDEVYPGALGAEDIEAAVKKARNSKS